jgi:hypothetical protein
VEAPRGLQRDDGAARGWQAMTFAVRAAVDPAKARAYCAMPGPEPLFRV